MPGSVFTLAVIPDTEVLDVLYLLAAAAFVAVGAGRIRLPTIPGYLIVGALIGPHAAKLVASIDSVERIGELAIILLMFTTGLSMDFDGIRSGLVRITVAGAISTLAVILALWPAGMAFGVSAPAALAIAMALSMSSTAVALGILQHRRETHLLQGRLTLGIGLIQDLVSVGILAVLPALAAWNGAVPEHAAAGESEWSGLPIPLELLSQGLLKLGGLGALLAFARYVLPRALREACRGGGTEQLLILSSAVGLGAAGLTWYLGFGPVLGAFLAGFMLASTPFKYQVAGQLSPLRDLFMAVFFTTVGMSIDFQQVISYWWIIAIGVALVLLAKTVLIGLTTWACGATAAASAVVALLAAQAGEFTMVVVNESTHMGLLSETEGGITIAITVFTLVFATPWYDLHTRVSPRLRRIPTARWVARHTLRDHLQLGARSAAPGQAGALKPDAGADLEGAAVTAPVDRSVDGVAFRPDAPPATDPAARRHVIIAGFGVVGRNLAEHLAAGGITYTVVELNAATVRKQQSLGRKTVYGDIANPDVLRQADIHNAAAVMLTIPDDEATLRACQAVRAAAPAIFIAARTSYLSKAIAATELGADYVTVEEVVTAQDMAKHVMHRLRVHLETGK